MPLPPGENLAESTPRRSPGDLPACDADIQICPRNTLTYLPPPVTRPLMSPSLHSTPPLGNITPKQTANKRLRDWYPYYAGFPEDFVGAVLAHHFTQADCVLDPWSGTGTTTAACLKRGFPSKGIDINPALTVIAKARLTPCNTKPNLLPLATRILHTAEDIACALHQDDLLLTWLRPQAVRPIRAIQHAIHLLLTDCNPEDCPKEGFSTAADSLPIVACFYYAALFSAVRDLLNRFGTTNPTWLRHPRTHRHRLAPTRGKLHATFLARIAFLSDRLSLHKDQSCLTAQPFQTGSATALPFRTACFDGALTSPPYATRIDYVTATLPELAVLGLHGDSLASLRRNTIGTSSIKEFPDGLLGPMQSRYASKVLEDVLSHSSKGSRTYYGPWMRNYLVHLQASLAEISRLVAPAAPICIVVQDSYYKELLIDLQRIIMETLGAFGRPLACRYDYTVTNPRSQVNPKARNHFTRRKNTESLLVFS